MTAVRSHFSNSPGGSEDEDSARIHCPSCARTLSLHQPDERLPDRLLGTCRSCLAWFLVDGDGAITFHLPDPESSEGSGSPVHAGGGITGNRRTGRLDSDRTGDGLGRS